MPTSREIVANLLNLRIIKCEMQNAAKVGAFRSGFNFIRFDGNEDPLEQQRPMPPYAPAETENREGVIFPPQSGGRRGWLEDCLRRGVIDLGERTG